MKKMIDRVVVVCDYCDAFLGDAEFAVFHGECRLCGKNACRDHGAQVYYKGCEDHGVQVCRIHLPKAVFLKEEEE